MVALSHRARGPETAPERAWWLGRPIGLRPITSDSRLLCLIRTRLEDGWCSEGERDPRDATDRGPDECHGPGTSAAAEDGFHSAGRTGGPISVFPPWEPRRRRRCVGLL